jgi:hypothetical protein
MLIPQSLSKFTPHENSSTCHFHSKWAVDVDLHRSMSEKVRGSLSYKRGLLFLLWLPFINITHRNKIQLFNTEQYFNSFQDNLLQLFLTIDNRHHAVHFYGHECRCLGYLSTGALNSLAHNFILEPTSVSFSIQISLLISN